MDEKIILESVKEKLILTKVNIVGEKFFHVFEDSLGNKAEIETTEANYRQLGTKTPSNPVKKGYVWKYSYSRYKFDTIDGNLHDKEYFDNGDNLQIKIVEDFVDMQKEKVVENLVSKLDIDSAVEELSSLKNIQIDVNRI